MAEETPRAAQLWDTLQEAASTGDLQRLKDALTQFDDEDTDALREPNMAEKFAAIQSRNRDVKRQSAMQRLLNASAREGHVDVASYLVSERHALVNAPAVRYAMTRKRWAVMQMFLDRGWWDINQPTEDGNTLPILREILPSELLVRWCLEHGADPNARSMGRTNHVLGHAAKYLIPVHVLRVLRDVGGADFAQSDALHHAVKAGARTDGSEEARERRRVRFLEVMAYLVDEARFPVDQLEWEWDPDMFEDIRRGEALGTALHCAAKEKCIVAIEFLLKRGAGKDVKDSKGKTAAKVAEEAGFKEGVAALR